MNDTQQLLLENEWLTNQVSYRQQVVSLRIELLQQLLKQLLCFKSKPSIQHKKKLCIEAKQEKWKAREVTSKRVNVSNATVLHRLDRLISDSGSSSDVYQLSILLSDQRNSNEERIAPSVVRRALVERVLSDLNSRHSLMRLIVNILLPSSVRFPERIPYYPSSWVKRRHELSVRDVAERMKVSVVQLTDEIRCQLLNSKIPFSSIDFEKFSTSICGMDVLATEIFHIAEGLIIRPEISEQ